MGDLKNGTLPLENSRQHIHVLYVLRARLTLQLEPTNTQPHVVARLKTGLEIRPGRDLKRAPRLHGTEGATVSGKLGLYHREESSEEKPVRNEEERG